MKTRIVTTCLAVVFLSGCVPSLHRLYDEKTVVFDDGLIGTWKQADGQDTWTFKKADESETAAYDVQVRNKEGKTGRLEAHLVRLEGMLFMDLYPGPLEEGTLNETYAFHLVPAHTFWRIERRGDRLDLAVMNPTAVKKMLDADPAIVKHERGDDNPDQIVLTGPTAQLQRFVVRCAKTQEGFGDPMRLNRQAGQPSPAEDEHESGEDDEHGHDNAGHDGDGDVHQ